MSDDQSTPQPSAADRAGDDARHPERWIHRRIEKYRRRGGLAFRPDAEFFRLAEPVVTPKRTLLGYDRLYTFWQAIGNVQHLDGAVAEVGTFRGGSAYFIASAFLALTGSEALLHVFDTFEGHPADAISERDTFHTPGQFGHTNATDVTAYLSVFPALQVHQGDVLTTLPRLPESGYRLVHVDTDLYRPTKACLEYFGSRLVPGGVAIIDDYEAPKCPGVAEAAMEYLSANDGFHVWDVRTEQLVLVKR